MTKLDPDFYRRNDVLLIARELLGKLLVTQFEGHLTSGRIVETEAYNGAIDKASHAFNGRRTNRTEVMFGAGGLAYVYFCYGIHHLFNVVTNVHDTPHAVLIRGIEPVEGITMMLKRMKKTIFDNTVGRGPGNVSKSLGITTKYTGYSLLSEEIFIAADDFVLAESQVIASPRIGVDYAGDDAKLNYRFYIKNNPFVSGKKNFTS